MEIVLLLDRTMKVKPLRSLNNQTYTEIETIGLDFPVETPDEWHLRGETN
jgi:hypothetical protein